MLLIIILLGFRVFSGVNYNYVDIVNAPNRLASPKVGGSYIKLTAQIAAMVTGYMVTSVWPEVIRCN